MVKLKKCEDCGKNQKYFRSAYGSYKCYGCGKETHVDTPYWDREVKDAYYWWQKIKNDEKIKIYKLYSQGGKNGKTNMENTGH